jgi:hypothetical protein
MEQKTIEKLRYLLSKKLGGISINIISNLNNEMEFICKFGVGSGELRNSNFYWEICETEKSGVININEEIIIDPESVKTNSNTEKFLASTKIVTNIRSLENCLMINNEVYNRASKHFGSKKITNILVIYNKNNGSFRGHVFSKPIVSMNGGVLKMQINNVIKNLKEEEFIIRNNIPELKS